MSEVHYRKVKLVFEISVPTSNYKDKEKEDDEAIDNAFELFEKTGIPNVYENYLVDVKCSKLSGKKYWEEVFDDIMIRDLIRQQSEKDD